MQIFKAKLKSVIMLILKIQYMKYLYLLPSHKKEMYIAFANYVSIKGSNVTFYGFVKFCGL